MELRILLLLIVFTTIGLMAQMDKAMLEDIDDGGLISGLKAFCKST